MRCTAVIAFVFLVAACSADPAATELQFRLASERSDNEVLLAGLEQIKVWHQNNATGLDSKLGTGVSTQTINRVLEDIDCRPTDELSALWSWHDGATHVAPFIWYHDFLSLEDAVSGRWMLRLATLPRWDGRLIPVFEFDGEWYATYCAAEGMAGAPIVHVSLEDEPRVAYINLTTFIVTMAQAMNQGAVRWEGDAMVEDIHELHRIYQAHNPGYAFPYYVPPAAADE